jgi:chemotaxis protein MotB
LSTDRANTARRTFTAAGLPEEKFARIIGMSSYVLLDAKNPRNPMNRRISIVVMTEQAEAALRNTESLDNSAKRITNASATGASTPVRPVGPAASPAPMSPLQ